MISIRLSEEEYGALKRLRAATDARSVSDMTRAAMRVLLIGKGNREHTLAIDLARCSTQLMNIEKKLNRLASKITAIEPSTTTD